MKKRRGNSRFFVIFVSVIAGSFLFYNLIHYIISNIDFFLIRDIRFEGQTTIPLASLTEAAYPLLDQNLYKLKNDDIRQRFQGFHRIAALDISRRLPNILLLKIQERIAVFHIKSIDGEIFPVDESGIVIPTAENNSEVNLPFISVNLPAVSIIYGKVVNDKFLSDILLKRKEIILLEPAFFDNFSEIYMEDGNLIFVEAEQGYRVVFDYKQLNDTAREYMKIKDTFSFNSQTRIDMRHEGLYRITKLENE